MLRPLRVSEERERLLCGYKGDLSDALTFSEQPPAFSETDQTSRLPRLFLLLSLKFIQTLINLSYPLNIPCIWSYEGSDRLYE